MAWSDLFNEIDAISGDRRSDRRYQMDLELRWRLIRRKRVRDAGLGRTIDLSSGGILFDSGRQLPAGMNVELSISWPVLLRNVAPLQLVVTGRITRSMGNRTAIQIQQHEFRTAAFLADRRDSVPVAVHGSGVYAVPAVPRPVEVL